MLKLSDLSISSIDCAVALSSSISRTRMPIPFLAALGSDRRAAPAAPENALGHTDSKHYGEWLTEPDSHAQAFPSRILTNRRKMLRESGFPDQFSFMLQIKNRPQPTLVTRPSLGGWTSPLPLGHRGDH